MATKMAAAEGKKRSENFSKEETIFLCEEVEKRIDIIRSKQTNNITNAKKAFAWRKITDALNARGGGGVPRSVDQIKEKWRKACSKAKNEKVKDKISRLKTGGGPKRPDLDPVTQKVLDLHEEAPNFIGLEGGVEVGINIDGKYVLINKNY